MVGVGIVFYKSCVGHFFAELEQRFIGPGINYAETGCDVACGIVHEDQSGRLRRFEPATAR
jgi:hypothetical protein